MPITKSRTSLAVGAVLIGVWALPWAALGVVGFNPWLAPGPAEFFDDKGSLLTLLLFGLDWLVTPIVLLAVGEDLRHRDRSRRWFVSWSLLLLAGAAFGALALIFLDLLGGSGYYDPAWNGYVWTFDPAHPPERALVASGGFALLALVMWILLAGSPRALACGGRRAARWAARTRRGRVLAVGGALGLGAALAVAVPGHGTGPVMRVPGPLFPAQVAVAFSPDGRTLAVVNGVAEDVTVEATLRAVPGDRTILNIPVDTVTWGVAEGAAFDSGGSRIALALGQQGDGCLGRCGGIEVRDTTARHRLFGEPDPIAGASVFAVAFSPDGRVVAGGDNRGGTVLWDARTGRRLSVLRGPSARVDSLAFSPDGRSLAVAYGDGPVRLWDVGTRTVIAARSVPARPAEPIAVLFRPHTKTLVIAGAFTGAYRWATPSGRLVAVAAWHGDSRLHARQEVTLSPDGRFAAVAAQGAGGTAAGVWSLTSGLQVARVSDPVGYRVSALALTTNGRNLAFTDEDGLAGDPDRIFLPSAYVWRLG